MSLRFIRTITPHRVGGTQGRSGALQDKHLRTQLPAGEFGDAGIETHQHAVPLRRLREQNGIRPLPVPLDLPRQRFQAGRAVAIVPWRR